MPPVALRPRSTTEIIDAAVQLLRLHYQELVATTALFMIPIIALRAIFPVQLLIPGQFPTLVSSEGRSSSHVQPQFSAQCPPQPWS